MEDPTQLQRDDTAPWEQLPYECRMDWTKEGTDILKQRSLEYICTQPDNNTYYIDGLSDGTRVAAALVHKEEEILIRLNDLVSVLDAEMTAILENARETSDNITIHTHSLTDVNVLSNRKLNLNTITKAIRDAASRLTQRPTINWIPAHTGIPGNENAEPGCKERLTTWYNTYYSYNKQAYNDASQQTKDHRQLHTRSINLQNKTSLHT